MKTNSLWDMSETERQLDILYEKSKTNGYEGNLEQWLKDILKHIENCEAIKL